MRIMGPTGPAGTSYAHVYGVDFMENEIEVTGRVRFEYCNFAGKITARNAETYFHQCNFESPENEIANPYLTDGIAHNRIVGNDRETLG